jgi:transglutaminase-like putative cysteine protease
LNIGIGYELIYQFPQPTPMLLMLNVHYSRASDIVVPDNMTVTPSVPISAYRDGFGNWCTRLVAPAGQVRIAGAGTVRDAGLPDPVVYGAIQHEVQDLPEETLVFLLGSRYCETDRLGSLAWSLFGGVRPGWERVQAIVDYVHRRIEFGYRHARPTRTAEQGHEEGVGVCRDYAHLAVTLCRAMNIPARYCTGYLGDIGVPAVDAPMDFSAWFEAYLEGGWYTFDARHNQPRIGRIVIARGRDATDVAMTHTFGTAWLTQFQVITEEVEEGARAGVKTLLAAE